MDKHLETNRRHWDELVPIHKRSEYYDVDTFKAGRDSRQPLEVEEVGDVQGKTLLHLQCHFGMDTLSWARRGAAVTGADFSLKAIEAAQALAAELGIAARFVCSDIYSLPDVLDGEFDIVYTSYGALCWLPDLGQWAHVIAHFLRPGGTFYVADFHSIAGIFETENEPEDLMVSYPYFPGDQPLYFDEDGSYADRGAKLENRGTYSWPHPLSEIVTALIDSGLRIEYLHEFPFTVEPWFPFTERGTDGYWRLTRHHGSVPLLFSVRAVRE